jgi:hypothetical protein
MLRRGKDNRVVNSLQACSGAGRAAGSATAPVGGTEIQAESSHAAESGGSRAVCMRILGLRRIVMCVNYMA